MSYFNHAGTKKLLDQYVIPGYLAFGEVISTDTGKALFRFLYEAKRDLARATEMRDVVHRDYATRKQEEVEGWFCSEFAKVNALRTSFALLMAESSHGAITQHTAVRIVNNELAACALADCDSDFYNAGFRKDLNKLCNPAIGRLSHK